MRRLHTGLLFTACCTLALSLPAGLFAQETQPETSGVSAQAVRKGKAPAPSPAGPAVSDPSVAADSELPDSPGAAWSRSQFSSSQQSSSSQSTSAPPPQSDSSPQDQKLQHPVGTAAAGAPEITGLTAAEPSGVAMAPAKQRRVRTIVLKVGAIVGAGVALGAVIALSAGTSSKPPGAR